MRTLLSVALATLTACGSAPLITLPLGQLVVTAPRSATMPTTPVVHALLLPPSESTIWDVRAAGMTIGRAELEIGDTEIHSRFHTSALASMFATMQHDLVTTIDRANSRPVRAQELVVDSGETSRSDVIFDGSGYAIDGGARVAIPDGNAVHTLHSALGWIRAWADPSRAPSSLYVLEDRELFRLDLDRPTHEVLRDADTLRIDGHIHHGDDAISISLWLTADADRRPIRILIIANKLHITAELVS